MVFEYADSINIHILRQGFFGLMVIVQPLRHESTKKEYKICFCHELSKRELKYQRQVDIPITYDGMILDEGLRLDVLVEELIICELKVVDEMNPVWEAQILSHLTLTGKRLGFLINFTCLSLKTASRELYYNLRVLVAEWIFLLTYFTA